MRRLVPVSARRGEHDRAEVSDLVASLRGDCELLRLALLHRLRRTPLAGAHPAAVGLEGVHRDGHVLTTFHERPQANQLHVSSTRCGNVPGTHKVFFDGTADTIELTHTARSREGFAVGAVESLVKLDAALKSGKIKRGGLYGWDDIY